MTNTIIHGVKSFKRQYLKLKRQHQQTLSILKELKAVGPNKRDLFNTFPKALQTKINEVLKNDN